MKDIPQSFTRVLVTSSRRGPQEAEAKQAQLDQCDPGWRDRTYENGSNVYATDGTMLDPNGKRSIFDDVDE